MEKNYNADRHYFRVATLIYGPDYTFPAWRRGMFWLSLASEFAYEVLYRRRIACGILRLPVRVVRPTSVMVDAVFLLVERCRLA